MGFQSEIRADITDGIVGEFAESGPIRAFRKILNSTAATNNVFGRAFTLTASSDDTVAAGGTGAFAGIMVNPKEHALLGTSDGTLEGSLQLPNNVSATMSDMGIIYINLEGAGSEGDNIEFDTGATVAADAGKLYARARAEDSPSAANRVFVPGAKLIRNNITSAGTAIIQITN